MTGFSRLILLTNCVLLCGVLQAQQEQPDTAAASSSSSATIVHIPPPPAEPPILEDGGFSVQANYWLTAGKPNLRGGQGLTDTTPADLYYPAKPDPATGVTLSIPAGNQNSLRISYFRVQGAGPATASQNLSLFDTSFSQGDYLNARYRLQNAKISWDYLGYTWHRRRGPLRLKTLYELQYTSVYSQIDAPLRAISTDSSGTAISNTAQKTLQFFSPTFGLELEQPLGRHFRWEAKASGFGYPHHWAIWDGEASAVLKLKSWELLAGEKAFHYKTSPAASEYLSQTLSGAYVGVRWYWGLDEK